jgi:hypothetical protein
MPPVERGSFAQIRPVTLTVGNCPADQRHHEPEFQVPMWANRNRTVTDRCSFETVAAIRTAPHRIRSPRVVTEVVHGSRW